MIFVAILLASPTKVVASVFAQTKDPLETRESYLDALPYPGSTICPLGGQEDACLSQLLAQILAAVSEICQEPPRYPLSQVLCIGQKLFGELDIGDVGSGELVGERNAVGRTQQMQLLHPVNAETSPPHPPCAIEACSLRNLARVDDRKECRIDQQGFRVTYQFAKHRTSYGFQEASELSYCAVK